MACDTVFMIAGQSSSGPMPLSNLFFVTDRQPHHTVHAHRYIYNFSLPSVVRASFKPSQVDDRNTSLLPLKR